MSCNRANIDLVACEGNDFEKTFTWMTGDPAAGVNISTYQIYMHVRTGISSKEKAFEFSVTNGYITKANQYTDPGKFTISVPASHFNGICKGGRPIAYKYDIVMVSPSGKRTLIYGDFTVMPAVTRTWEDEE